MKNISTDQEEKIVDCRSNEGHSDPYSDYVSHLIYLNQRSNMKNYRLNLEFLQTLKGKAFSILCLTISLYFLVKIFFLIYTGDDVTKIILLEE